MKKQEWNEGLNHLDLEIIEKYTLKKDALNQKRKPELIGWTKHLAVERS